MGSEDKFYADLAALKSGSTSVTLDQVKGDLYGMDMPQSLKDQLAGQLTSQLGGGALDKSQQQQKDALGWGGAAGGADADVARYRGMADKYSGMQAPSLDYRGSDYFNGMGNTVRKSESDALGMMQQAAMGNAPSQAQIMMRQGNDQATASQMGMAASARGPAALALAQQQAAGNVSAAQTTNANNMGALRAQEMASARSAYMGGASGMRTEDLSYSQLMQQRAQNEGQLGLGYQQLGLQGQMGLEGMGYNVKNAQMGQGMDLRGQDIGQWEAGMKNAQDSRAESDKNFWNGVGAINTGINDLTGLGKLGKK